MLRDVFETPSAKGEEPAPAKKPVAKGSPAAFGLMFAGFLVLLLLLIIFLFGYLSLDPESPLDILRDVRTASGEKRVMAAYKLSHLESYDLSEESRRGFIFLTIKTFEETAADDARIRRHLALTLGRLGDPLAVESLVQALRDPDPETQLYATWALGALGDPQAVEALLPMLSHEDAAVRKTAAFALGEVGDVRAVPELQIALQDPVADVTWNAAVALARLGNMAGLPILRALLDGSAPTTQPNLPSTRQEMLRITVLRALRGVEAAAARKLLRELAENDPSSRIRSEARRALEGKPSPFSAPGPSRR